MKINNARYVSETFVDMDITFEEGDVIPRDHRVGETIPFTWSPNDNSETSVAVRVVYSEKKFPITPYTPPRPVTAGGEGEKIA